MAIPYFSPYPVEELDTPDCRTLIEIVRSDEQWANPERRMLACHLHCGADSIRKSMKVMQRRISQCQADDIEQDLAQLEETARQLALHRKEMKAMQETENTILSALNATKNRLSNAEFNKREVERAMLNNRNLLIELCRPELEAAGFVN